MEKLPTTVKELIKRYESSYSKSMDNIGGVEANIEASLMMVSRGDLLIGNLFRILWGYKCIEENDKLEQKRFYSECGKKFGLSDQSIQNYLDAAQIFEIIENNREKYNNIVIQNRHQTKQFVKEFKKDKFSQRDKINLKFEFDEEKIVEVWKYCVNKYEGKPTAQNIKDSIELKPWEHSEEGVESASPQKEPKGSPSVTILRKTARKKGIPSRNLDKQRFVVSQNIPPDFRVDEDPVYDDEATENEGAQEDIRDSNLNARTQSFERRMVGPPLASPEPPRTTKRKKQKRIENETDSEEEQPTKKKKKNLEGDKLFEKQDIIRDMVDSFEQYTGANNENFSYVAIKLMYDLCQKSHYRKALNQTIYEFYETEKKNIE